MEVAMIVADQMEKKTDGEEQTAICYFINDNNIGLSYLWDQLCIGNMEWQIPTEGLFLRGDTKRKLEKTGKKITKILEEQPEETEGEFELS
jgi:hypothetical protein